MLTLVNEDLMSFDTISVTDKNTDKMYFKLKVLTSNKLIQPQSNLGGNRGFHSPRKTDLNSQNRIESNVDPLVPVNKEVIRVSAPLKRLGDIFNGDSNLSLPIEWKEYPMTVNIAQSGRFSTQIDVRCHEQGEDRANVFVVAFPFNGMIKPLKEDPKYRIYKGFISSSIKPFFYNNHKYRKILYLVIEINKNLFRSDHKYHTNCIPITFESFAIFEDRETGQKKTNHETMQLDITSTQGDYNVGWTYELINDAIMMNAQPGENLWPTYVSEKDNGQRSNGRKPFNGKPNGNKKNSSKKNSQRPFVVEGNTVVTTNKHGIRKEIPMNNRRRDDFRERGGYRNSGKNSLDEMIERSGMYDKHKNDRGRRNGGKQSKFKRY